MEILKGILWYAVPVPVVAGIVVFLASQDGSRLRKISTILGWTWVALVLANWSVGTVGWAATGGPLGWILMFGPYKRRKDC
jgi:energy-coupling factor transporter transmembrane protein EcfT